MSDQNKERPPKDPPISPEPESLALDVEVIRQALRALGVTADWEVLRQKAVKERS